MKFNKSYYNDTRCPVCANKYEWHGVFRCRLKDDFWLKCRFKHVARERIDARCKKIKKMLAENRKDKEELQFFYAQVRGVDTFSPKRENKEKKDE